jgi:hypothetical protein
MWILILALIAAALLFGASTVKSVVGQALAVIGIGCGLVAIALLSRWATGSAVVGLVAGFGLLVAIGLWAHFSTPREFRGMSDKQIDGKLKADLAQAKADYEAAAAEVERLRPKPR